MKKNFPRHCERSEAIQPKWMAVSCLVFMVIVFSFPAFACVGVETFSSRLKNAEVVFEGALVSREKHEWVHSDGLVRPIIVNVFVVDKNWKGTKKGRTIKASSATEGYFGKAKIPTNGVIEIYNDAPSTIIMFSDKKITLKDQDVAIYKGNACPGDWWPKSFLSVARLAIKYPLAVFQ